MRSDAKARLAAVLVVLASCGSADDLMYAYTGKQAGSGQDPGVPDPGPADPSPDLSETEARDVEDVPDPGPADPSPDLSETEARDVEDVPDAQETWDIVCVAQDHKGCVGGNLYWYDSCGVQGELAEPCTCGCTGSSCDCCPSWTCGGWSVCSCGNTQARTCTDSNSCGITAGKPAESQVCDHCGNGACDCGETNGSCSKDCPAVTCPAGYVLVPAGQFTMGSSSSEPGATCVPDGETYPHQVTIGKGFCLKETEVTQGEWQALMGNNPSYFSSCGSTCPVEQVSWWDAVAYCNRLSSNEGLEQCYGLTGCSGTPGTGGYMCTGVTFVGLSCTGYRLPTESEWEYAARAGTTGGTYNGTSETTGCEEPNGVLDPIAWWCGNSGDMTHAVKGKQANAWGLYDMLGNVWEWVEDCWHGSYDGDVDGKVTTPGKDHPTDGTAWQDGCSAGSDRVRRGGGCDSYARYVRAASRYGDGPGSRDHDLGFRPARSRP